MYDINRQSYLQDSRSVYLNQRVFLTVVLGPIVTTAEISATNERAGYERFEIEEGRQPVNREFNPKLRCSDVQSGTSMRLEVI